MKKLIIPLAFGLCFGTINAGAQHTVPPQAVRSAFNSRFPNAEIKKWQERKNADKDAYTAYFKLNGKKEFAYYTPDGTWKGTGTPVKWSWKLPKPVKEAWKNSPYAAWYIMDMKKIRTPDQTLYQIHLNNSPLLEAEHYNAFEDECKLVYSDKGRLLTKEVQ